MYQYRHILFFVCIVLIAALLRLIVLTNLGSLADEQKLIEELLQLDWTQIPVHFYGYGWGENVVLAFLAWPFVVLYSTPPLLTLRLIVLFANLLSMILLYELAQIFFNRSIAMIALVFAALWPWHIIAGSVGFNVFLLPAFLLGAMFFALHGQLSKKSWPSYVAAILLGVSLYTYAAAFTWVPILLIAYYISFRTKLRMHHLLALCVLIVISIPIALFHLKSQFGWPPINQFSFMHYPPIPETRFNNISVVTLWDSPVLAATNYLGNYLLHYVFLYLAYNPFYATVGNHVFYGLMYSGLGFLTDPYFYEWAPRNGLYVTSLAFLWDPFLIVAGLYALIRRRIRTLYRSFILVWLALYPIGPSFINGDSIGYTTTRDIFGMPVLILLSACGLYAVWAVLRRPVAVYARFKPLLTVF